MQALRFPLLIAGFSLFFIYSCNKSNAPEDGAIIATLHDNTGFDGCTWVIKLDNDEVLEPVNLGDFNHFELKDRKKIWIKYRTVGMASICMVGPTVEIEAIWDR